MSHEKLKNFPGMCHIIFKTYHLFRILVQELGKGGCPPPPATMSLEHRGVIVDN